MNYKNGIQYKLIAMALTALSLPSYALTFQNGVYGGILLGENTASATWNGVDSVVAANNNGNQLSIMQSWSPPGSTSQTNFSGHPYLGYQWVGPKIYLATEIGGTFSNNFSFSQNSSMSFSYTDTSPGGTTQTIGATANTNAGASLSGSEFDMDFKSGFIVKERGLIYARGGLAFNTLKIFDGGAWTESGPNNQGSSVPSLLTANAYSSNTNHVVGIRIGVGTEYLITEHFGVLLDYTYTRYGDIQTTTVGAQPSPSAPGADFTRYEQLYGLDNPVVAISTQAVMLGISYHG